MNTWAARIVEGIVVGISASVMLGLFTAADSARHELETARQQLLLQVKVNQGLLVDFTSLASKVQSLEEQVLSLSSSAERGEDFPKAVPYKDIGPNAAIIPYLPNNPDFSYPKATDIQIHIDAQRELRKQ